MISGFRKSLRSWATIALLMLALVAIVITGFGTGGGGGIDSLSGGGSSPAGEQLATVDGDPITSSAVNDQFNRAFQQLRQQLPNLEMAEYLNQGGYEGAVTALINFAALRRYGEARGLVVTEQMVDRFIVNQPVFHDAVGQYDPARFQQFLQATGVNERALRSDIARDLMRQQLIDPVRLGMRVPQGVARFYAAARLEQRRGTIGVVPVGALEAGINPSEAEIAAHYARNRARFAVAERRVIKYAVIGAEQAPPAAPTEAEIAAVYRNTPRYQQRETRTIQSITFSRGNAQATAQAFAQRVRGGTPFVDAARAAGFAASDVTFTDQSQAQFAAVTSNEVAATVFRAAQGSVTGPVRSPLGVHVVRVERVTPIAGRPLEAVRADIVRELERRKRGAAVTELASRLQQQLDEGGSLEEVARAARLTVVTTPPITAAGLQANGQPWQVPADLRPLLAGAFEIDAEDPVPAIAAIQENARYALLAIDRVEPSAVPPLAQIRERVRAALIREQALRRARDLANAIVARINSGVPAARAFAEAQPRLPAPESIDMRRLDIMRTDRQAPPPLMTLFRLRPGTAEAIAAPNGAGWFVVAAQQSVPGNAAQAAASVGQVQQELQETAATELELQFMRAVTLRANVQRNDAAILAGRRALNGNPGPVR
jgi:peptidyl-prolyl cis-trans isomerase D